MFICQTCNKQSKPHEKPETVVVETRTRNYVNHYRDRLGFSHVKYSTGIEIVSEKRVCHDCSH